MLNEKFLFGFLNLGDDMLFPDWSNTITKTINNNNKSYTSDADYIVYINPYSTSEDSSIRTNVTINGIGLSSVFSKHLAHSNSTPTDTDTFILVLIKKNDVISASSNSHFPTITLKLIPLVKSEGGGGTKRYLIAVGSFTGATA